MFQPFRKVSVQGSKVIQGWRLMSVASTYHATHTLLVVGDIPGEAQYLCPQDGEAALVFGLVNIEDSSIQVIDRIFQ
jgi:hypothetical protein